MDGETPRQNTTASSPEPLSQPGDPNSRNFGGDKKTIQPLNPHIQPEGPAPQPQAPADPQAPSTPPGSTAMPAPSSIYPEATRGIRPNS